MSLTLGEKLRQAREDRGLSISEVAEQTRISPLYLQSIENDDYNILPGGIFNKGFVKSFAKFVGIDEQEALEDYAQLISRDERNGETSDLKVFRPEVLTDDRSAASMAPTIIIAAIILALMTIGLLFLVDYMRQPPVELVSNTPASNADTAAVPDAVPESPAAATGAPDMSSLRIEFTAIAEPVSVQVTSDGKTSSTTVAPGTSVLFEPKESLRISYSRSLASVVQMTINGKKIELPAQPFAARRNAIEFEINKANIGRIWEAGAIVGPEATSPEVRANTVVEDTARSSIPTPARAAPLRPSPAGNADTDVSPPRQSADTAAAPPTKSAPEPSPDRQ